MLTYIPIVVAAALAITLWVVWARARMVARAEFIRSYSLPIGLFERLRKKRPELTLKDCQLVSHALRQFFLAHLKSGRKFVSMPSQVVDDMWHELILYTRTYQQFCDKAFGQFLHHTPAVVLSSARTSNTGLRRCWWYACLEENINPRQPTRLPLLFAIDGKLNIGDGFRYVPDCKGFRQAQAGATSDAIIYCGGDFSSPAFDGSTDGFGDSGSDCGGGDGGDSGGCGGGCGGGD